jgi:uncharacterized membrane protein
MTRKQINRKRKINSIVSASVIPVLSLIAIVLLYINVSSEPPQKHAETEIEENVELIKKLDN